MQAICLQQWRRRRRQRRYRQIHEIRSAHTKKSNFQFHFSGKWYYKNFIILWHRFTTGSSLAIFVWISRTKMFAQSDGERKKKLFVIASKNFLSLFKYRIYALQFPMCVAVCVCVCVYRQGRGVKLINLKSYKKLASNSKKSFHQPSLIKPMTIHTELARIEKETETENGKQKLCHCTPQMRYSQFVSGIVVENTESTHPNYYVYPYASI